MQESFVQVLAVELWKREQASSLMLLLGALTAAQLCAHGV